MTPKTCAWKEMGGGWQSSCGWDSSGFMWESKSGRMIDEKLCPFCGLKIRTKEMK